MKKLIGTIVAVILLALLGVLGINIFKGMGPRERVKAEDGERLVVEDLGWYSHGEKQCGKIWKPADENGCFPDSMGTRPVVIFFHDPMKSKEAGSLISRLVSQGVIGYTIACPDKEKDIETIIRKMGKESFADKDLIFIIADTYAADATVKAILKVGSKTAGLILIGHELQGKSAVTVRQHASEILEIDKNQKSQALDLITDYMEIRGAFK